MSAQHLRQETPPSINPAAWFAASTADSGFDGVATLAVLLLGGPHRQPHLLADGARQKPAHGMRLPAGQFHQLFCCYAPGPLEQVEDLVGLAALVGDLRFLRARTRFLGGAGLLSRLGSLLRNVGAPWRTAALFGGLWLLSHGGWSGSGFWCRGHDVSFGGDYR